MQNLLENLKKQTRPNHDEIEKNLNLLRADMDINQYTKILLSFLGFYRPLENLLKACELPFDYSERYKEVLLCRDLAYLDSGKDLFSIPEMSKLSFSSIEEILGALYVVEGSTLGGQLLSRHFASKFDLCETRGLAFFCGYQEQTMNKWKEFQNLLLKFSSTGSDLIIIESAKKTFHDLETWMVSSVKM